MNEFVRVKTRRRPSQLPSIIKTINASKNRIAYDISRDIATSARRRVHSPMNPNPNTTYIPTGNLRRSIARQKIKDGTHRVVVGASYGAYEEYGTRHRPGHPFLRPAVEEHRRILRERLKGILGSHR